LAAIENFTRISFRATVQHGCMAELAA
jgi:hypothetical protein